LDLGAKDGFSLALKGAPAPFVKATGNLDRDARRCIPNLGRHYLGKALL